MRCPKCGASNKKAGRFCHKCGASLEPASKKSAQASTFNFSVNHVIAAVLVLIGTVLIALVLSQPAPQPVPPPLQTPPIISLSATLEDIMAGKPVVCALTRPPPDEGAGMAIESLEVKWEYPRARMDMTAAVPEEYDEELPDFVTMSGVAFSQTVIKDFSTGKKYANLMAAMLGPYWWDATDVESEEMDVPTPEVMFGAMEEEWGFPPFDCALVSDIPDSEFELPPDAIVKDISEMTEDFADQALGNVQIDLLDQGYPLMCAVLGTHHGNRYNLSIYLEGSKFAEDALGTQEPLSVFDGSRAYLYVPQQGYWLDVTDAEGVPKSGREVLRNYLDMRGDDLGVACIPVGDIADYKFRLPEDAKLHESTGVVPESRLAHILDAIEQGKSLQCRVQGTVYGDPLDANLYVEGRLFMLEDWGTGMTMNLFDGENVYENYEDFWDMQPGEALDSAALIRMYEPQEDLTVMCVEVDDVPDSYFQLPQGAVLLGDTLPIDEAMEHGYPVECVSSGSRDHDLYLEGSKFAIEDRDEDWYPDNYKHFRSDGSKLFKYMDIHGEPGWLDVTEKYSRLTPQIIYDNYVSKRDEGELTLECGVVDDIPDEYFLPE